MSAFEASLRNRSLEREQRTATDADADQSPTSLADAIAREKAQNERLRAVDLESWYARLAEFTFRTQFVAFSPDEARAMMAAYRARLAADRAGESPPDILSGTTAQALCGTAHAAALSASDGALLEALETRVQAGLDALPGADGGVFAKLSSRSPKDSRVCEAAALARIQAELGARLASGCTVDSNDVAVTVMGAAIASLRVRGARGVLQALVTSDRVCEDDLPLALSFVQRWSQHIVLREWIEIPTWCELRAFVFGGRLTGLQQYFKGAFFPELVAARERVVTLVQAAFATFGGLVGLEPAEYVLDLAVDMARERVWIIELNPFGKPDGLGTGTGLFSLADPHDAAVLFGEAPFEFRLEEAPSTVPLDRQVRAGPLRAWLVEHGLIGRDAS